ncbi:MAG: Holliday junction resolvase RuvX [Chloroflexi bacterium]|nr:Holliday junction resolvase RuvX [Chloroflexota bacterium]
MAGKLLALDVGLARIGIATCDPLWLTVRPITVLHRTSRREDFVRLAQFVRDEEAIAVICGLPFHMDGSDNDHTQTVRKWAMRLAQALRTLLGRPIPVIFWDERLTTFAAQAIMTEQRVRGADDAVAASVILQSYLDAQRQGDPQDFGRIELPTRPL